METPNKPPKKTKATDGPKMAMKPWDLINAKYKFNIYQKRIELCIVDEAQAALRGERHIAGRKLSATDLHPVVEIPLNLILQDEDESNYSIVKKSAKAMTGKVIEYTNAVGTWTVFSPIVGASIPRYSTSMFVEVHRDMWNAILDYRQGWRKFDIKSALSLKSVYSIKLYELISLHTDERFFSVNDMKDFFGVKDKYKEPKDFVRRVLDPVKKELDEASPWSFNYVINRASAAKQSKIIGFTIQPYPNGALAEASERQEALKKVNLSAFVPDRHLRMYLLDSIGFTQKELLGKNKELLGVACKVIPDLISVLELLKGKARAAGCSSDGDYKAYIIAALRGKVDDYFKAVGQPNPLRKAKGSAAAPSRPSTHQAVAEAKPTAAQAAPSPQPQPTSINPPKPTQPSLFGIDNFKNAASLLAQKFDANR